MKNLIKLMEEFSILGMEPNEIDDENGLEFGDDAGDETDEYELDADGNPVLDADGNPIKKVKADNACTCDHDETPEPELNPEETENLEDDELEFNI